MSDSHQAIYDAVRSKISGGNIGDAVQSAIRDMNLSHYAERAMMSAQEAAWEQMRPSVVFKPKITKDGNQWCALLGDNLQEGVAGFGDTPNKACYAFDAAWNTPIAPHDDITRIIAEDAR
jgi:hypothetical protein